MTSLLPSVSVGRAGSPSSTLKAGSVGKDRTQGSVSMPIASNARKTHNDLDFNLGNSKARVLKLLDDRTPTPFKKFFAGPLYDSLLNACLLYFTSRFMHDWIVKAMDKARKQHLEGYNPYAVAQRLLELEEEMEQQRLELSPIYSQIILKYSSYDKQQQDRMFFECLYDTLVNILCDAFCSPKMTGQMPSGSAAPSGPTAPPATAAAAAGAAGPDGSAGSLAAELAASRRSEIESEIGALFRSRHFNSNQRKYEAPRSVDTLGVKELYSLKHETTNRALNAKMLSSLYAKPPSLSVQVASVTNSPLIAQYISSPIVARAKVKDPLERKHMFESLARAEKTSARVKVAKAFRSMAAAKGVDVNGIKENLQNLKADAQAAESLGLMPAERSYRSDRRTAPRGILAPESIGLAADEQFNTLALLKRYILYGPLLGFAAPNGAPGQQPPGVGGFPTQQQQPGAGSTNVSMSGTASAPTLGGLASAGGTLGGAGGTGVGAGGGVGTGLPHSASLVVGGLAGTRSVS
ncbi:hypothetical protein Vafri_2395 [Volvox africanus]|nr:hypothetical protein Vafri_2395 [Volvox africanus]